MKLKSVQFVAAQRLPGVSRLSQWVKADGSGGVEQESAPDLRTVAIDGVAYVEMKRGSAVALVPMTAVQQIVPLTADDEKRPAKAAP